MDESARILYGPQLMNPTDLHPEFELERLQFLAELFVRCRDGALEKHEAGRGETAWALGCRCYDRMTYAIEEAAASGTVPWLSIIQGRRPGEQFVFRIGTQPVRFYTGTSARPNPRSLRVDHPELRALELFGSSDGSEPGWWLWRIAIGVGANGRVSDVTLLQTTRGGDVRLPCPIPFSLNPQGAVVSLFKSGIELDGPDVGVWEDEKETKGGGRDD